jgi:uncharacterized protein (TIGR03032 family)
MSPRKRKPETAWDEHGRAWRDPAEVVADWAGAKDVDPGLLRHRARGEFWETLERSRLTLWVSREYEHLALAITVREGRPLVSFQPLAHPSGIAYDKDRGRLHIASSRNPNRVFDFAPATKSLARGDSDPPELEGKPLVPVQTRFLPGALYTHDLALVDGELHANAVGENAVVRLPPEGGYERAWWPRSIERRQRPDFSRNYLQLNSIAAGPDLASSFFTASAEAPGRRRPGHKDFPVDRRGVVFSGATREPVAGGLTRPHSARLHRGRVWVLDSGYGGLCRVDDGRVETIARLPGWTRGLGIAGGVAWVATSRVIPRFRMYAPGLDLRRSVCGVHAVELRSGSLLGSLIWPQGNQVFAVEPVPARFSLGFPFPAGARRPADRIRRLFYGYMPPRSPR